MEKPQIELRLRISLHGGLFVPLHGLEIRFQGSNAIVIAVTDLALRLHDAIFGGLHIPFEHFRRRLPEAIQPAGMAFRQPKLGGGAAGLGRGHEPLPPFAVTAAIPVVLRQGIICVPPAKLLLSRNRPVLPRRLVLVLDLRDLLLHRELVVIHDRDQPLDGCPVGQRGVVCVGDIRRGGGDRVLVFIRRADGDHGDAGDQRQHDVEDFHGICRILDLACRSGAAQDRRLGHGMSGCMSRNYYLPSLNFLHHGFVKRVQSAHECREGWCFCAMVSSSASGVTSPRPAESMESAPSRRFPARGWPDAGRAAPGGAS